MANGKFAGGNGTELNPYLIEDSADLSAISENTGASSTARSYFKIINNITLSKDFLPIGLGNRIRYVDVNGNYKKIKGLYIEAPDSTTPVGFFGYVDDSVLSNIVLDSPHVVGGAYTGSLVGRGSLKIVNCYVKDGHVSGGSYTGGIVGLANGNIEQCGYLGSVYGINMVGGLAGRLNSSSLNNFAICKEIRRLSGTNKEFGGLVGSVYVGGVAIKNNFAITESMVPADGFGLTGVSTNYTAPTQSDNYYNSDFRTLDEQTGYHKIGSAKSTSEMLSDFLYSGWDSSIWVIEDGKYPTFQYIPDFFVDKTLILHDDEYKKYGKALKGIKLGDLLPFPFTSNTTNGVTVSASRAEAAYPAYFAFDKNNDTQWISIVGNALSTPQYLTVEFDSPKKVTKIILNQYNSRVTTFRLQYSDDGIVYTTVLSDNIGTFVKGEDRTFDVIGQEKHKYWRLSVDTATNPHGLASLTLIGEIEDYVSIWQAVSSTLPTSTQFVEHGMDSLSPLLDRKVTVLEPQALTQDTSRNESGKVFKKSIDLKKYFDIRSINITN